MFTYRRNTMNYRALLLIAAVLISALQNLAVSQEFSFDQLAVPGDLTTQAATGTTMPGMNDNVAKEIGAILFKNGYLIEGKITLNKNLFIVEGKYKTTIPTYKIEYAGIDRFDVYRYMRSRPSSDSYEGAAALGRWCMSHSMPDQAITEFERTKTYTNYPHVAKTIDKEIAVAMQLKRKMEQTPELPEPQTSTVSTRNVKDAGTSPDTDLLYAIVTPPVLEKFRKDVQPYFVNRCAAVDCHGTNSSQEFKLVTPMREYSSAEATKRNLKAVFDQLDFDDIPASPIIRMPLKEHGGAKKLYTQQSKKQFEAVYQWAQMIPNVMPDYVAEIGKRRQIGSESTVVSQTSHVPVMRESPLGAMKQAGFNEPKPSQSPTKMVSNSQITQTSHESDISMYENEAPQAFLGESTVGEQKIELHDNVPGFQFDGEKKKEQKITDPFDPKAFNERYHK